MRKIWLGSGRSHRWNPAGSKLGRPGAHSRYGIPILKPREERTHIEVKAAAQERIARQGLPK